MPEIPLTICNLCKNFGTLRAVQELNLTVLPGDIYGFLGLNGAGKTTTLRMVLGLLFPSAGQVRIFGKKAHPARPFSRRMVGALVDGPAFFGRLSGLQNLLALGRLSGSWSREQAERLLGLVGLSFAARRPARSYSMGMKQRLGIALALAGQPRLVILDEPTNGLDPEGIRDIRALIQRLNQEEGQSFLISSHLLPEVEQLCNRVGIIHQGQRVLEGEVATLVDSMPAGLELAVKPLEKARLFLEQHLSLSHLSQKGEHLVLTGEAAQNPADLISLLVGAGFQVVEAIHKRPTLETVFLQNLPAHERET